MCVCVCVCETVACVHIQGERKRKSGAFNQRECSVQRGGRQSGSLQRSGFIRQSYLFLASGEELLEAKLLVSCLGDLGQCRLAPSLLQELGLRSIIALELRILLLELDREGNHHPTAVLVDPRLDLGQPLVLLACFCQCVVLVCSKRGWVGG
jgi:hypothetical protein